MPKILISLSFLSILLGCATTSRFDTRIDKRLTPPLPQFLSKWHSASATDLAKLEVGSNEDNIRWWKIYTLANLNKKTAPLAACEGFKSLSQEMSFPLHDLALIRAHEVCAASTDLADLPASVAPWYRELFVDIKYKEALATSDLKDDLAATIDKARQDSN